MGFKITPKSRSFVILFSRVTPASPASGKRVLAVLSDPTRSFHMGKNMTKTDNMTGIAEVDNIRGGEDVPQGGVGGLRFPRMMRK